MKKLTDWQKYMICKYLFYNSPKFEYETLDRLQVLIDMTYNIIEGVWNLQSIEKYFYQEYETYLVSHFLYNTIMCHLIDYHGVLSEYTCDDSDSTKYYQLNKWFAAFLNLN